MKVLMFSSDRGAEGRMKRYGEALEKLEIVFFDRARGRLSRFFKGYAEAKKILKKERFDLITAQEIEHSFLAWRLSKKFSVPWQMQIHTDIFSPYFVRHSVSNRVRVWLAHFLIPRASCIRVVSERIKRSIWRDAIVLPIFSEVKKEGASVNLREKYPGYDFYILMVGRLAREKNYPLALEIILGVLKSFDALLVIVGEGPEREALKLQNNVKLEGWQESISGYYRSADVLLLTSNYEGYGLAALEAIQNGLPVVMSDVGLAGEIIKNGENGMVVPVGDKDKFIQAIIKLREDTELRKRLAEGAKNTKMPHKSFEEYRDKLVNSWKTCLK